jgi:hypothetical protein
LGESEYNCSLSSILSRNWCGLTPNCFLLHSAIALLQTVLGNLPIRCTPHEWSEGT